ncbi:LysR family transcriptional regulator [Acidovorax sp. MR-S7]|uniref:LysR family transcriptional regulator n=1 Tax=unclassified Acidovorax TaxID=2684926 RepID=UPI000379D6B5|nr:LysR family transcriptional regulator [Acidovorax sp. MR-S7]GAD22096.1 transcriptional regulator [Acidovorax sp. MR-S7]
MKMDTTTVRLVLAVAEEGSISRAADRMQLAVAAASKRLTDLEQQLGTRLFKRQPHGVRITEPGLRLLGHIRQVDNLMQRLEGDALALGHGRDGRILIGAPKAAIIEFLARDLAALQAKYPEITLQVQEENSKIVQQLLRDKVIDIGIFEKTSGFIDLPQADYRRDRLVLVYSRAHFQFGPSALPLDAVLGVPLVTLGRGSAILAAVQRAYQSRGRVFHANYTVNGFDTMLALVRQGLGVGLMPPAIFESFHPEAALAAVALEGDWHERRYVLSFVEGQAQEQTLRNVVAELLHRA